MAKKGKKNGPGDVEKTTPKQVLVRVLSAKKAMQSVCAEERQAYGDVLTRAVEADHLNKRAFAMAAALAKLAPEKQAIMKRDFLIYCDQLGIGTQGDMFDAADGDGDEPPTAGAPLDDEFDDAAPRAEAEARRAAAVDDVLKTGVSTEYPKATKAALKRFREAIVEAEDNASVSRALDRFQTDYPAAKEEALGVAQARLQTLADANRQKAGTRAAAH